MSYPSAFKIIFLLWMALFTACTTTPRVQQVHPVKVKNTKQIEVARSFLRNIGAGKLALNSFNKAMEEQSAEQPGLTAVVQRAFKDINEETLLDLAANVYSRHVSLADLIVLENYSQDEVIQRYFNVIFDQLQTNEKISEKEFFKQFDEDGITKIMKFAFSDSFGRLQSALPSINKDLADESRMLGERVMRDYIKSQ